jgi:hypothetical protein
VSPANGALITVVGGAGVTFRKNFIMDPMATTLATADLPLPKNMDMAGRETYDGISMRFLRGFDITNDVFISRLDILYGYTAPRPEWGCAVADVV